MRQPLLLCIILCVGSTLCYADCYRPEHYQWLLGHWSTQGQHPQITETWHQVSEQTFEGTGTTIKQGKIVAEESLRLLLMDNQLFYLAKVSHNPLPIAFKLTQCSEHRVSFENPSHDFPNRIEYQQVSDSELTVNVRDNKGKGFSLTLIKQPKPAH